MTSEQMKATRAIRSEIRENRKELSKLDEVVVDLEKRLDTLRQEAIKRGLSID